MAAPTPAPASPSFLGGLFSGLFAAIPGILLFILRMTWFVILSILVLPSMVVMLYLHKPWESMLTDITTGAKKK